jgi:Peptidase family M23
MAISVSNGAVSQLAPHFSCNVQSITMDPDGRSVLVTDSSDGDSALVRVPIPPGPSRELTIPGVTSSALSRDGKTLAYVWSPGIRSAGVEHIVVANSDGTKARTVYQLPLGSTGKSIGIVSLSGDGKLIAFGVELYDATTARLTSSEIWVVGADGSHPLRIGTGIDPAWQPVAVPIAALAPAPTPTVKASTPTSPGTSQGFLLPWPAGQSWTYVGGPHTAFEAGTPWGAVDFQPPNSAGCSPMEAVDWWIRPVASGVVVRADSNYVEIDHENGWRTVYYHVGSIQVKPADRVTTSTDLGHPSCYVGRGGRADGRHVHLAFIQKGAWVDLRTVTVKLSGWEIRAGSDEYSGSLYRNGVPIDQWGTVLNDGVSN